MGEIGARHAKTSVEVALRWLIQQNGVIPIPRAKNAKQAEANSAALHFELSPDEIQAIAEASASFRINKSR